MWPPAPPLTLVPNHHLHRDQFQPQSTKIRNKMDWSQNQGNDVHITCKLDHDSCRCPTRTTSSVNDGEGPSY